MNTKAVELLELSVAGKIQIVEDIWDSISNSPAELPLFEAEKPELGKRLADYQQNPNNAIVMGNSKKESLADKINIEIFVHSEAIYKKSI